MVTSSSYTLKFIVTGGGITGLTCAYLLKKGGHEVVVLEKLSHDELLNNQIGGLRIPPNMTRLLQELPGTEKLLREKAVKGAGMFFHQCEGDSAAELVGKMVFAKEMMDDLGCDFFHMSHKDLHEHIYTLCTNVGVEIHHEFEVVRVISRKHDSKLGGPTVVGKSGELITGDIVIGADGKNSCTRRVLLAEKDGDDVDDSDDDHMDTDPSKQSILPPIKAIMGATMSIPVALIKSDPELVPFLTAENYLWIFMGNGTSVYMMQSSSDLYSLLFNCVIPPRENVEWLSDRTPVTSVLRMVDEHDPRIKKLIQLASTSRLFIQNFHNPHRHVSKYDDLVVIGDAAHSIYINGTHHTAAAFEEAFTFGWLFSKLPESSKPKEHASHLLSGYRYIQRKRTRALEINGMDTIAILSLISGPERERRNNGFRLTLSLDGADDATLEKVWAGYIAQFNYDARDAVDEWWMNWSKLSRRQSLSQILTTRRNSHIEVNIEPSVEVMA